MIRSLLHVGMTVPDLEIGRAFYELFGLEARASGNDLVFRCEGSAQEVLRLMPGARKKLSYVSLGTNEAGMQSLLSNLDRSGVAVVTAGNNTERPPPHLRRRHRLAWGHSVAGRLNHEARRPSR